ncbi:uncharacterized protein LOC144987978 [Oryzias latipes]
MDQWEEPQEGAPPSRSRDGNHDNQSKAQRNQPGPGPGSRWGSKRSETLEDWGPDVKNIRSAVEQIHQRLRTGSGSEPSCVSFRSDWSKGLPIDFKSSSSSSSSGPSVQQHQTQLDSIFLLLEDNIVTFVKKELKKIQKLLSHREDEEELEVEDEGQRSSRESLMKITVNFLRRMKQEELADGLESSKRISLKVSAAEK